MSEPIPIVIEETMLMQLVRDIIGMGIPVEMKNGPRAMSVSQVRGGRCEITISSLRTVGTDERRENKVQVPDPDNVGQFIEVLEEEYVRLREATISFRFESDAGPNVRLSSYNLAECLRNALYQREYRIRLKQCGCAVQKLEATQDFDMTWDNRRVDVAVLDMQVNIGYSQVRTPDGWFTTVVGLERDPTIITPGQVNGDGTGGGWFPP